MLAWDRAMAHPYFTPIFGQNLAVFTPIWASKPLRVHGDFDLGHREHCLNLAILTPIGLVLSEVFRSDVYIRGFHGRVIFG